jgi:hypothetical protein
MLFTWPKINPAFASAVLAASRSARRKRMSTVLRVADRGFIHTGNPGRDGIAARNGLRDPCLLQRRHCAAQSLSHPFHSPNHPLPGDFLVTRGIHRINLLPEEDRRRSILLLPRCEASMPRRLMFLNVFLLEPKFLQACKHQKRKIRSLPVLPAGPVAAVLLVARRSENPCEPKSMNWPRRSQRSAHLQKGNSRFA